MSQHDPLGLEVPNPAELASLSAVGGRPSVTSNAA
jgi:hypothetical protein